MNMINKAVHRIEMMIVKALINQINDGGDLQLAKIEGLAGEVQDGVERLQPYGLSGNPPLGSEALVVYLNGNRDHGVIIVCDPGEYRVRDLNEGEVALYSKHGQALLLNKDGDVEAMLSGEWRTGNGSDFVAMSTPTKLALDAIQQACANFAPPGTPDGGAALATAISGALLAVGTEVASANLKAD